jgi:thiol-disulfide isomerase/thioredoxin
MFEEKENKDYFENSRYVKELIPSDFESAAPWRLKKLNKSITRPSGMVLFYAPWCPYCKSLKPIWEEAAKISGFCDYYAFNCEKYKGHILKLKEDMPELIRSYPSIIIYNNGEPDEYYEGERTSKALILTCARVCSNGKCGYNKK